MRQEITIWKNTTNGLEVSDIREIANTSTVELAMALPKETRVYYLKKENPVFLKQTLFNALFGLVKSLNFQPIMAQDQMIDIVDELIRSCPDWSIHDFIICFKNGKFGKYCTFYNSINGAKIFEMVLAYEEERSIARERQVGKEKTDHIQELSKAEIVIDILKKATETDLPAKPVNNITDFVLNLTKTPLKLIAHIGGEVLLNNTRDSKSYGIDENIVISIQNYFQPFVEKYNKRETDYNEIISRWNKEDKTYELRDEILDLCEKITDVYG